ncbi:uncharacterized protein TRIADDRAFT_59699 [Trichoplax adhaerens]|uniref:Sin3 histone deacetylase corepressor complex component SDS3 n=1 Tax=Trichoplax adhaerens TaxID=10228 RepID=B3S670_TRIAD|nr:hypothetical protein TRIADDRAFT_59699 [Trichoplax adhaerens]EDV21706.1 hypothetical protein TRIADDRAFT_59699 [Trichoplax adhaerens]|eukprot:XP_002115854.1 hypothetical protein TRIADDRAFT_59699 [Trichoplax adhaerens]
MGDRIYPEDVEGSDSYAYESDEDLVLTKHSSNSSDTEDASETDQAKMEEDFAELKEIMYKEKLKSLKEELQQIRDGVHPEYLKRLRELERMRDERTFFAIFTAFLVEIDANVAMIEKEHQQEREHSLADHENLIKELKDSILSDLQDKKRTVDAERQVMEITGNSGMLNKTYVIYCLLTSISEQEILDDLKLLQKSKPINSKAEARIEDGKLFYEKRWYHRGQHVYIEGKDTARISGILSSIGHNELINKLTIIPIFYTYESV